MDPRTSIVARWRAWAREREQRCKSNHLTSHIPHRIRSDQRPQRELLVCARCTYNVLRGADLLGQVAALHGAEVQVLAEQLAVQDVPHGVLQTPPVGVHHPGECQADAEV